VLSQAACRYAAKCQMLGDKWVQVNPMTERLEFLHIQQSMLDVFTKKWAMQSTRTVVCVGGGRAGQGDAAHTKAEQEKGQGLEGELGEREKSDEKDQRLEVALEKGKQEKSEEKKGEQARLTSRHTIEGCGLACTCILGKRFVQL
jgi:hypothetical protein